ncbi:MAG: hypothetical protein M1835_000365 [Candelina submexicana]|nr:MAG: hypothetical protein M1835_000365 [Candelina submexicana]
MPLDVPIDSSTISNTSTHDSPAASITCNDAKPTSSASKKRKAEGSASRGVANLTPEQLAKKRAADREAQRAIRERTKNQIETLENRIRELEAQQPYLDLQYALRQKEAVEAQNEEIRKKLASVLAIVQPLVGRQGLNDLEEATSLSVQRTHHNGTVTKNHCTLSNHFHQKAPPHVPTTPSTIVSDTASPETDMPSPASTSCQSTRRGWPAPGAAPTSNVRARTPPSTFHQQRDNLTHGLDLGTSGEKLGFDFLLDSRQQIAKLTTGESNESSTSHQSQMAPHSPHDSRLSGSSVPRMEGYPTCHSGTPRVAHCAPILNITATCPLDSLLLDFLAERQQQAAEGVPSKKLVGPAYPSVSSLLNPEQSVYSHPVSKVFTDILATFPDLSSLPEQVAVLFIMFLIMRWQISPTQENYDRLPDWVTPRPSQLFTPHPAWIDHLPWPRMRDKMVDSYQNYPFENWFIPYTTTLSLNWPYEPTDTLLSTAESDDLMINPVFERHLRNLNNWSLGPAFAKAFPALVETTRIEPTDGKLKRP